ncbi:MAG: hypothetical protein RL233_442 [Bacteroidota bacterium]
MVPVATEQVLQGRLEIVHHVMAERQIWVATS